MEQIDRVLLLPIVDPDGGIWLPDPDRQGWTKIDAKEEEEVDRKA